MPEPYEPDEDPIVLWDDDEPVTDSQLREIVDEVAAEMAAGKTLVLLPYWRNETSGILQPAMMAYINHGAYPNQCPAPTPEQMGLIKQYLQLYINAPCWEEGEQGQLAALRKSVQEITDLASCDRWLDEAMQWGFDPL
ncbi:MAG: hypothetical protein DCF22_00700 [Leptolyngbya sp.]|nr:MAG: hypothetical protein DCF22_00700 [Leptolyngbya sp.]